MAVSVADHRARVLATVAPVRHRLVPLPDAAGLVTARDVVADLAVPRFDHAAMDGYAVRAADIAGAPLRLPVDGVIAAGDAWTGEIRPMTALRIMTGAPVPAGADLVVPFEWTDRGEVTVTIRQAADAGRHIRVAGEDVPAGSVPVPAGTRLRAAHLGLLAAVGCSEVPARPRPRVAVIATGAELVDASYLTKSLDYQPVTHKNVRYDEPPAGMVPDANTVTIAAAVRAAGGTPTLFGPAPDDVPTFLEVLTRAAGESDLVVTTGGISAGDHDVVKAALGGRAALWFGDVAVKPGRPQGAGIVTTPTGRDVPVVCLPGTPVAAYSSFQLFAVPAIRALQGLDPVALPATTRPLAAPLVASPDRTLVLPGRTLPDGTVEPIRGHVGHSQRILADADVLLVVPPGEPLAADTPVDVIGLASP